MLISCRKVDQEVSFKDKENVIQNTTDVANNVSHVEMTNPANNVAIANSRDEGLAKRKLLFKQYSDDWWYKVGKNKVGNEKLAEQRSYLEEAVIKLGPSSELIEFLTVVSSSGSFNLVEDVYHNQLDNFFINDKPETMRQFLLNDKLILEEPLLYELFKKCGASYYGDGFANYFEKVGKVRYGHNCQCRFLTGYCSTMARTDPIKAIHFYREMAKPKGIDDTGIVAIMDHVPANADFVNIAAAELGSDSEVLAKLARTALLHNWSVLKPAEAAQYVMTNTSVVHADQMAVVMNHWAKQSADDAAKWLAGFDSNAHKDQGYLALAKNMQTSKPAQAFAMATSIGDYDLKVKTATESFTEWAKTDRQAAEAAWAKAQ